MKFRTMGVDVAGWNFGLDKLNRELDRHQFIRELTQNGIEAIQQTPEKTGNVTWELYPLEVGGKTVNKLCCIDSGIGMTGPELVEYINTGFKSGKQQGHKGNFGIGAKVSALTFNKFGVLYLSWKDGQGAMIHLAQDQATGFYGLNQLARGDGTYGWWAPISDDGKPNAIKKHGTIVVLLGDSEDEDTFEKPEGSDLPASMWVGAYLHRKYLKFPDGVTVRARGQSVDNSANKYDREIRLIYGQAQFLDKWSEDRGVVQLSGAKAHYWLLKEDHSSAHGHILNRTAAHSAAVSGDELHEVLYGTRGGYQRLASFGVSVGQRRVVIHVEPDPDRTESNLTRQYLLFDGQRLPWEKYAAEFSENLPSSIKAMMHDLIERADSRSNKAKIAERLKELKKLLAAAHRYRLNENGDVVADTPTVGGEPRQIGSKKEDQNPSGGEGGLRSHIDRLIQTVTGDKAKKKKAKHQEPEVVWISAEDRTRERGYLEDRAAVYFPAQNTIYANKDFRAFRRVVKAVKQAVPQANGSSEAAAMLEFETILVETVMNLRAMEGTPQWSEEEIKQQFTPEAMTNAVNHTFHIVNASREEVKLQLRKAQKLAREEAKSNGGGS